MKILISAAEASSDLHGARLLAAVQALSGDVQFFGIGGEELRRAGLRCVAKAEDLLAMGSSELFGRLPKIIRAGHALIKEAEIERPDVAVLIDYPEFHLKVAARLKRLGIPVICYVPPKIWVWRQGRARRLSAYYERVLCILPFEVPFLRSRGVHAKYVGNPLSDELPRTLSRKEARDRLGLSENDLVITLMPGSRPSEVRLHTRLCFDAVSLIAQEVQSRRPIVVVVPLASTAERALVESLAGERSGFKIHWITDHKAEALAASDVGIIKSGTSTLEAAWLGCPHVIIYRTHWLTAWIYRKWVKYSGAVGLSNLVHDPESKSARVFKECLLDEATPTAIAQGVLEILKNPELLEHQKHVMREVRRKIDAGSEHGNSPSHRVAAEVLEVARTAGRSISVPRPWLQSPWVHAGIWVVSALWSTLTLIARRAGELGVVPVRKLSCRVMSVGNIQAGGAGKTPLVAHIAREAADRGLLVTILIRGVGGEWEERGGIIPPSATEILASQCGDEAALLHHLAPQAWIGVGRDRGHSYDSVRQALGRTPDLVVLDDGFQHWKIKKDLEIVALTSHKRSRIPFRDWDREIRAADLLVWTKGRHPPQSLGRPLVRVEFRESGLSKLSANTKLWVVTGLADPDPLMESLRRSGAQIEKHFRFPDHVHYTRSQIEEILALSGAAGAKIALTGKDWVKWKELGAAAEGLCILEPEVQFLEGRDVWSSQLWGEPSAR